jgi:pentatricopeptide repeat protein
MQKYDRFEGAKQFFDEMQQKIDESRDMGDMLF